MFSYVVDFQTTLQGAALGALRNFQSSGWAILPTMSLVAFIFGLLHALLPGHGKLLLGARFAQEGSRREAFLLSSIVIGLHIASAVVLVLAGSELLGRTLGNAGRAPVLEKASNALIVLIGCWLLFQALRPKSHEHRPAGVGLALSAGLIPCPLTTFTMAYAVANNAVMAGLMMSLFFGLGMIGTVVLFPLLALGLRQRGTLLALARHLKLAQAARAIAATSALAIILIGAAPLTRALL